MDHLLSIVEPMTMDKNAQYDFSDAESLVDSVLEENGSPSSNISQDLSPEYQESEGYFSPQDLADALLIGSQGLDYNFDYKNNSNGMNGFGIANSQSYSWSECSPPNMNIYQQFKPEPYWHNQINQDMFSNYQNSQMFYNNLFQQQPAFMKSNNFEKQFNLADIFQMDQSTTNKDIQQDILLNLMKQKDFPVPHHLDSVGSSAPPSPTPSYTTNIPSPTSSYASSIPSPQQQADSSPAPQPVKEEHDDIDLDEEMLINTFKTLAEFVNNENIKPPVAQTKEKPAKPKRKRSRRGANGTSTGKPRLYNFLREILDDPATYSCIEWVDKTIGLFKFLDSAEVARLWGYRKNKPSMKYENFARSLRTYIAKGILTKPRNKLVYCFAKPLTA